MAKPNEKTPLTSKPTGRSPFFYFFMLLGFLAAATAFGAAVFFSGGAALPLLGGLLFTNFTPIIASVLGGLTLAVAASVAFGVLSGIYNGLKALFRRVFSPASVTETLLKETDLENFKKELARSLQADTPTDKGEFSKERDKHTMQALGFSDLAMPEDESVHHITSCLFQTKTDLQGAFTNKLTKESTGDFMSKQWPTIENELNTAAKPLVKEYCLNKEMNLIRQEHIDPTKIALKNTLSTLEKMADALSFLHSGPRTQNETVENFTPETLSALLQELDGAEASNTSLRVVKVKHRIMQDKVAEDNRDRAVVKIGGVDNMFVYFSDTQLQALCTESLITRFAATINQGGDLLYRASLPYHYLSLEPENFPKMQILRKDFANSWKPIFIAEIKKELPKTFAIKLSQALHQGKEKEESITQLKQDMKTALKELTPGEDFAKEWSEIEKTLDAAAEDIHYDPMERLEDLPHAPKDTTATPQGPGTPPPQSGSSPEEPPAPYPPPGQNH